MTNSSSDDEYKSGTFRHEKFDAPAANYADADGPDGIEEKKLVRKIDWRLLPILGALYSISLVRCTYHSNRTMTDQPNRSTVLTSPMPVSQVWATTWR